MYQAAQLQSWDMFLYVPKVERDFETEAMSFLITRSCIVAFELWILFNLVKYLGSFSRLYTVGKYEYFNNLYVHNHKVLPLIYFSVAGIKETIS